MKCPYDNATVELKDSKMIYGRSYGNVFICSNFPKCNSYVGVHKKNNEPLGTLANAELRELRKKAHKLFDPIWKGQKMTRYNAYKKLSNAMGTNVKDTHIGMLREEECKLAISLLENKLLEI